MTATRFLMKAVGVCALVATVCLPSTPASARTIEGTAGRDILVGTEGRDRIRGGAGDDAITARGGVDVARGDAGDDLIVLGHNRRVQEQGYGGSGDDWIYGRASFDKVSGNAGNDRLFGGQGSDTLIAGDGDDRLSGGRGNDNLEGDPVGGAGAAGGNDVFRGGPGDDELDGLGTGRDRVDLGPGTDVALVEVDGVRDVIDCGPGRGDRALYLPDIDPLDEHIGCEFVRPLGAVGDRAGLLGGGRP